MSVIIIDRITLEQNHTIILLEKVLNNKIFFLLYLYRSYCRSMRYLILLFLVLRVYTVLLFKIYVPGTNWIKFLKFYIV